MVRLLFAPVKKAKRRFIPGGSLMGFVTQRRHHQPGRRRRPHPRAAHARGRISRLIAAATLVLGCSGGRSLYNPGDADLAAIQKASNTNVL
jgi:hypothetical protein